MMRLYRALSGGSFPARRLCTAAAAAAAAADVAPAPATATAEKRPETLYRRLSALPATGNTVAKTLDEYIRGGRVIRSYELHRCIRILRKRRRYLDALQIMEWLEVRNVNFSHKDLATRLDLVAKARGIDAAEKYFNAFEPLEKNKLTYGTLLNCYCQEKMEEKALSLFKQMEELGVSSTFSLNNLITLYMKLGQPEKIPALVEEVRERSIPLNTFTYNVLIHSYGCVGDLKGMERVYEKIVKENDDNCDWTIYSNLAVQYSQAGILDKAKSALKSLEEDMSPRDRKGHHFLISMYAAISDLLEVHRVWNLLKSGFPRLRNLDYIVVLQALDKMSDVDGVTRLYSEWKLSCTPFTLKLTNLAIRFYLQRDMIRAAESVLQEAIKRAKGPLFTSWELFIEFHLRERNTGGALMCLEAATSSIKDNQWKPNPKYIKKLLEYFEEDKDVNGIEELCKMLKRINCLDSTTYLLLFHTYIAAGKTLADIRKGMEENGIEINSEIENLLQGVYPK